MSCQGISRLQCLEDANLDVADMHKLALPS